MKSRRIVHLIILVTVIVSIILQSVFGFGLELIKVLAYLFFAYAVVLSIKKFWHVNWKATTTVIIAVAVIAVCAQIVFGKGLDILIWFICLIGIYELLSGISRVVRKN